MDKTKNAAGPITPAANYCKNSSYQNNISSDKNERCIHRSPIKLQRSFPTSLKQLHQWCLAGTDKQPLNPNGYLIDVTNPANRFPFDEAISAASKICAGVGFILTGTNIVIVDVDHCINPDNSMSQIAADVLKLLPTYAEVSQSKTGLHLIYIDNDIPAGFTGKKGTIEIYTNKRYVALTGWKLPDSPDDLITLDGLTKRLLDIYFPIADFNNIPDDELLKQHSYPPAQSDEQVLQSLQTNQKFQQLYAGNISGYPSQSEADGALMLILATATALNAPQMRRLFSQSALGNRDKWTNRKWYQDYLISGAIRFAKVSKETDNMEIFRRNNLMINNWTTYINNLPISRKTGWSFTDKPSPKQRFLPGCYLIGANPGIGKTTFCYQLGEQLAEHGTPVLFVSCEMSDNQLLSKSISRYAAQHNIPINNQQLEDANKTASIVKHLQYNRDPFYIFYAKHSIHIESLIRTINSFCTTHPNSVIIIDYLQYLQTEQPWHTDKQRVDYIARTLKNCKEDNPNLILIIISSFNRANYRSSVSMESFKETGGIEYFADVMWGLQCSIFNGKEVNTPNKGVSLMELYGALEENPRRLTLQCIKNRFGTLYSVNFDYYPQYDWFVEVDELNESYVNEEA